MQDASEHLFPLPLYYLISFPTSLLFLPLFLLRREREREKVKREERREKERREKERRERESLKDSEQKNYYY